VITLNTTGTPAVSLLTIAGNSTKWIIVNVNVAVPGAAPDALRLIWDEIPASMTGMTVKDELGVLMTTPALVLADAAGDFNAGADANVPRILLDGAPGALTIDSVTPAVLGGSVGNKEQNFAVVGFKLTSTTYAHVVDEIALIDGGFTTAAGIAEDVGAAYLYRDKGTIGKYDAADIRVCSIADVGALTVGNDAFDFNDTEYDGTPTVSVSKGPIFVAADSTVTLLVVMNLTGTAGQDGHPGTTALLTQENLAINIDASASVIDGTAALTGDDIEGPDINMVPLYITKVETADFDSDGLLDALKLTFSDNVSDSKWASLNLDTNIQITDSGGATGTITELAFSSTVAGDTANNNYLYVQFSGTTMSTSDKFTNGKPRVQLLAPANNVITSVGGNKSLLTFTNIEQNASVATVDKAPPVVQGAYTGDVDKNGKIDQITVSFSEFMAPSSANSYPGVTFVSAVSTFGSGGTYTPSSGTVNGTAIVYTVPESGSGIYDTESAPAFRYNPSGDTTNLKDAAAVGNEVKLYGPGGLTQQSDTVDQVPPRVISAVTKDLWTDEHYSGITGFEEKIPNGRIDTVEITFSERITAASTLNTNAKIDAFLGQFVIIHPVELGGVEKFTAVDATTAAPFEPAPVISHSGTYGSNDTYTTVTVYLREQPANIVGMTNGGDTGVAYTFTYTGTAGSNDVVDLSPSTNSMEDITAAQSEDVAVDKAAPFIVNGLFQRDGTTIKILDAMDDDEVKAAKGNTALSATAIDVIIAQEGGWADNEFSNIRTVDSNAVTTGSDSNTGDGYIDAFGIYFSEPVHITDAVNITGAFTVTNTKDYSTITLDKGVDANKDGKIEAADNNVEFTDAIFSGTSSKVANKYDTGETPTVKFVGVSTIYDGADTEYKSASDNKLAATVAIASYDTAKPAIVSSIGSVGLKTITVKWSEDVFSNDLGDEDFESAASNAIFGYDDKDLAGAGALSAEGIVYDAVTFAMTIEVNNTITVADVEIDSLWVKFDDKVYDDADGGGNLIADFTENKAESNLDGIGYKYIIDDAVAPYIVSATTLDVNGNGFVDYIKFVFSEDMDDASLGTLFDAINAMSYNAAANFILSGYTGMAKFNLFQNTDLGYAKSIDLGKPVFSDNAPDDNIMYLELQESKVPLSSAGTTGWAPELTFSGVTLSDKKPNALGTGAVQVKDGLGPIPMLARTLTVTTLEVTFSEEVNLKTVNSGDFSWTLGDALEDFQKLVAVITQPEPGVVVLETIVANRWEPYMGGTIKYVTHTDATKAGICDLQVDSKGVPTTPGVISGIDANAEAVWYKISSGAYVADATKGKTAASVTISTADIVVEVEEAAAPIAYALSENYPNPFNPTTTIEFAIPVVGNVELVIYNINGQKVRTLVNETKDAGFYKVMWDGRNELGETVSSGIYLYRLVSGNFSKMEKMTFIK